MSNLQNNRRSYGFNKKEAANRTKRQYNSSTDQERPRKTLNKQKKYPWWLYLLLLPFRLVYIVLRKMLSLWKKRPKLSKKNRKKLKEKALVITIATLVFCFLGGTILVAWASKDLPDPDKLTDRKVAQSTKIYDRTGEHLLYEIFADKKRTIVELDQIPQYLIDGVIATEDKKFYDHMGVRPLSILRAFVYGIFSKKRIGGTSTLTQQLVKNAILTDERTITRKLKELILSIRLEQKYSKDQILKIYFNEIPYGSTNYGVEAAAQSYFGKTVNDLNLQECATLAGLPKAPTKYLNDKEALKQRRDFVLFRMYEEGYISEEQKNNAQAEELTLLLNYTEIKAPHFVLYVKEKLVEEFGEQMVDTGGLKVITTLDWNMQQIAENVFEEKGTQVLEDAGANNMALVAIDPKTGQLLTMMGSKNFFDDEIDGQFNVATLGKRQPGSSFKPIIYTAAFEKGYTADTIIYDVVTNFGTGGTSYTPRNYDLSEHGPITMRYALQGSLNIPAVKTLYLVGEKKGVEFAERLGYSTLSEGNFGLSLVLGGGEVKLIEHVHAFGIFANQGIYQEPTPLLKVEDSSGDVLYEWEQSKGERVLDKDYTSLISNVLSDDSARAYAFGVGGVLTLPGRPVAAKTGTTNNYIDAWTVGYTPSLVAGVWAGNTNNSPMTRGFGGSKVAGPVWNAFMREVLQDKPVEIFPSAPANTATKAALRGSKGGSVTLKVNKVTGRLANSSTPEQLVVERAYIQPHSILHYVQKDDPRGDSPSNPQSDPQYSVWEAAISSWIKRKQEEDPDWEFSFEEPPIEEDDEYSLELMPTLKVVFPANSSTIYSRQINTDIRVSAPRGVTKVTYQLDGKYVGVIREHPFNLNYNARELEKGDHVLSITVEDDIGNRLEETINFTLDAGESTAGVYWNTNSLSLDKDNFPQTLFLNHNKLEEIEQIDIFLQKKGGSAGKIVKILDPQSTLFNNQVTVNWPIYPGPGEFSLWPVSKLKNGSEITGDKLKTTIK